MNNNIELLKTEVDDIKKSLNELKNNVSISETEKKNKAEALKTQAESIKQKIQNEINSLSNKTDEESKKKKEEAETLLNSFSEIMNLYDSVINTGKTKNGLGKTALRTLGFGLTGYAAYKGIKALWKIFGKKDEDKEENEEKKSKKEKDKEKEDSSKSEDKGKEKKGFRNKWYGKVLKRTTISSATGGGAYYLGKWFNLWGKKDTKNDNNEQKIGAQEQTTTKEELKETPKEGNNKLESQETTTEGGDKISEDMFQQLLKMEGSQNFVAKTATYFGENFTTGPYGMVYKHIDDKGNLLKKPVPFKEGEHLTEDRCKKNAKTFYDKKAKERKDLLDSKGYKYDQNMLDSLVCKSGGTIKSTNNLKNFVMSHWDNKDKIVDFISKHAITAAGNGKVMPGLVKRAQFAANWFKGVKKPFSEYSAKKTK